MKDFEDFRRVGDARGSNPGGTFRYTDGKRYYLKQPSKTRQASNEILASRYYDAVGLDAIQYEYISNGMVASPLREGLPARSTPDDLKESTEVLESFMPSALIANWDVIGLVYDNCLYDPDEMSRPVFLDFGGSFDTRAQGASKMYDSRNIQAYKGFTDAALNKSAATVYEPLDRQTFQASKQRALRVGRSELKEMMRDTPDGVREDLLSSYVARLELMKDTPYARVD